MRRFFHFSHIFTLLLLAGLVPQKPVRGQSPDFDTSLRHSKYYEVLKTTDTLLAANPSDGKSHFARAVALNCMFAFEEADIHFKKAAAAGIKGSESLAGNSFDQFNRANTAAIKHLPLKASFPSGKTGYQIGVRALGASNHVQIAAKMLPKLARHAESFFGVKPDRLVIFIMPDGDAADEFYNETKVSITKPDQGRGASAVKITVYYFEDVNNALTNQSIEETLSHEFGHVMHTLRNKEQSISGAKSPTWWAEGLATYFAATFLGYDKAKETALWAEAFKAAGSIPYNGFIVDFQSNERAHLHYRTASLMIRDIVDRKGLKTILAVIDDGAREDEYIDTDMSLASRAGIKSEELFNKVVNAAKGSEGH